VYAKTLPRGQAFQLIDMLRLYDPLNKDEIITALKDSWKFYKARASFVVGSNGIDILQWHYDLWQEQSKNLEQEDFQLSDCQFCCTKYKKCTTPCKCHQNLMFW
jgi:hypothetical protein